MMDDLIAMHMEFKQFYGSEDDAISQWMRKEDLSLLHHKLREVAFGQDRADFGGWMPMYRYSYLIFLRILLHRPLKAKLEVERQKQKQK